MIEDTFLKLKSNLELTQTFIHAPDNPVLRHAVDTSRARMPHRGETWPLIRLA